MSDLKALLALERNVRRAGFRSAASALADMILRRGAGVVRLDQGRRLRIDRGPSGWRAVQVRTGAPDLLVADEKHALVEDDDGHKVYGDPVLTVRLPERLTRQLEATARRLGKRRSDCAREAIALWLDAHSTDL